MELKEILMLTASDGCVPTPSESYDPTEFMLVEKAAYDCLMRIKDGDCERFDFPSITTGIDRRLRSHCERIKSGDVVIEVMVNVIEDTKREVTMTDEELRTKPTELQIANAMDACGTIGNDMIRRLAWQVDIQESLIRRAIAGLKHCGDFSRTNGSDPHPLDCSLAGRVAHVFGMGMTRACQLVRRHEEDPAFVNDQEEEDGDEDECARTGVFR